LILGGGRPRTLVTKVVNVGLFVILCWAGYNKEKGLLVCAKKRGLHGLNFFEFYGIAT